LYLPICYVSRPAIKIDNTLLGRHKSCNLVNFVFFDICIIWKFVFLPNLHIWKAILVEIHEGMHNLVSKIPSSTRVNSSSSFCLENTYFYKEEHTSINIWSREVEHDDPLEDEECRGDAYDAALQLVYSTPWRRYMVKIISCPSFIK
jgi:hypothetical protein